MQKVKAGDFCLVRAGRGNQTYGLVIKKNYEELAVITDDGAWYPVKSEFIYSRIINHELYNSDYSYTHWRRTFKRGHKFLLDNSIKIRLKDEKIL